MKKKRNRRPIISVAGLGYVGLANAVTFAREFVVRAYDIDPEKVAFVREKKPPFQDALLDEVFRTVDLSLTATTNAEEALSGADYAIVATPTDFDSGTGTFDTRSIEAVIADVRKYCPQAVVVIRSTIPIGYCDRIAAIYPDIKIAFVPEFLREGSALEDSLNPSRIVIAPAAGFTEKLGKIFSRVVTDKHTETIICSYKEAEAIKLFSNSYLAMRVAFFNEVETFARHHGLAPGPVISGICADERIGNHYNNPSFGYGGYCLPKDTKQLRASFEGVSQSLITAIVDANEVRKKEIASWIAAKTTGVIGIYRLVMKTGSDNMRESSIIDVVHHLQTFGADICIFEPLITDDRFAGAPIVNDLQQFKQRCSLIVCNRYDSALDNVRDKTYTPDIFNHS